MGTYREPGAEITQVQESINITAEATDLMAALIGPAYKVVDFNDYQYNGWLTIQNSNTYIEDTLQGLDAGLELDEDSICVEAVSKLNEVIPFYPVSGSTATVTIIGGKIRLGKSNGNVKTLLPNLDSSLQPNSELQGYKLRVAFRAKKNNKASANLIASGEDISNVAGKISTLNPLGFAASLLYQNSGKEFIAFAISGVEEDEAHTYARDILEFSDAYAFVPLTQDRSILGAYKTWVDTRSTPEVGLPSKVYQSPLIVWYDEDGADTHLTQLQDTTPSSQTENMFVIDMSPKAAKAATANGIASGNAQISDKRVSSIHPDMGWVKEERNVLQVNPDFVEHTSGVAGGKAVVAGTIVLSDGQVISNGTIITVAIHTLLTNTTKYNKRTINVYVPVAGYHIAAQRAALTTALVPSDPKTGYPLVGIDKIDYSEKFFGKTYTNVIAGGGTEVITQASLSVLPASRHHLTTDMTTIESREDNILTQVDIVTINLKKALVKLTGKFKQNARYFRLLRATLVAYVNTFVNKEFAQKIEILEIKQSPIQADKILIVIRIYPFYSANYIDVTLYY